MQSGWQDLDRGLSKGVQDWDTDESQWPISKYVEKTEAKIQCAGEAEFVNDIPSTVGELHAAFVLTSRANCDIAGIDVDAALVSYIIVKNLDCHTLLTQLKHITFHIPFMYSSVNI